MLGGQKTTGTPREEEGASAIQLSFFRDETERPIPSGPVYRGGILRIRSGGLNVLCAHLNWSDTPLAASTSHAMRHPGDEGLARLRVQRWFLSPARQGATLITTHCQGLGTLAWGMEVAPMEQEEGRLFVLRRASILGPEATDEEVQQVASMRPDEYAAAELLVRQMDGPIQRFLLFTSILARLQGKLCETVTEQPGGQATLAWLEQANLFLTPLDDERQRYRYHPLFAETLRERLLRSQPEMVEVLHRRAMSWFAEQGMIAEAIGHAREIGEVETIALLAETAGMAMILRNEVSSIMPWMNLLPQAVLFTRPVLFVYACWDMIAINRYPGAADMLQKYVRFHRLPAVDRN